MIVKYFLNMFLDNDPCCSFGYRQRELRSALIWRTDWYIKVNAALHQNNIDAILVREVFQWNPPYPVCIHFGRYAFAHAAMAIVYTCHLLLRLGRPCVQLSELHSCAATPWRSMKFLPINMASFCPEHTVVYGVRHLLRGGEGDCVASTRGKCMQVWQCFLLMTNTLPLSDSSGVSKRYDSVTVPATKVGIAQVRFTECSFCMSANYDRWITRR